jgi:hypothetical protein
MTTVLDELKNLLCVRCARRASLIAKGNVHIARGLNYLELSFK